MGSGRDNSSMDTLCCKQCTHALVMPAIAEGLSSSTVTMVECSKCGYKNAVRVDATSAETDSVTFTINGEAHVVNLDECDPGTRLVDYLRDDALLTGTKVMCRKGGCGACLVSAKFPDGSEQTLNSCLKPIFTCEGLDITTIEGEGSRDNGYSDVQKSVASNYATQCGMCTAGVVMSMRHAVRNKDKLENGVDAERMLDGNMCRCTGYRPIVTALHEVVETCVDIEDIGNTKNKANCEGGGDCANCPKHKRRNQQQQTLAYETKQGQGWYKPATVADLESLLKQVDASEAGPTKLVAGNVSTGIYPNYDDGTNTFVDISGLDDLRYCTLDASTNEIKVGALTSMSAFVDFLRSQAAADNTQTWLSEMRNVLEHVAATPLRNVASLVGNVMMTGKEGRNFQSDVATMMMTLGASFQVKNCVTNEIANVSTSDLLTRAQSGLEGEYVASITIPGVDETCEVYHQFKIMPRHAYALAIVNFGVRLQVDPTGNGKVVKSARIVVGGCPGAAFEASAVTNTMINKPITDTKYLKDTIKMLYIYVSARPSKGPTDDSVTERATQACSLFYKHHLRTLLHFGIPIHPSLESAAIQFTSRGEMQSKQGYPDPVPAYEPATQAMPKLESLNQTAGEIEYAMDMNASGMLHGAVVLATKANCDLALPLPRDQWLTLRGVHSVIDASVFANHKFKNDILGGEEVLASEHVDYAGQPVAVILAESQELALKAAATAQKSLQYTNMQPPITTLTDGIKANSFFGPTKEFVKDADIDKVISSSPRTKQGNLEMGSQYHYTLETQTCMTFPNRDGTLEVHSSSQGISLVQTAVASVLNVEQNQIYAVAKKIGGGFGGKNSRSAPVAVMSAVGAKITKLPVKIHLTMEDNMRMVGKRHPFQCEYSVGYNADGKVNGIKVHYYIDGGCTATDTDGILGACALTFDNMYDTKWQVTGRCVKTNLPSNTEMRGPGFMCGPWFTESILQLIAEDVNVPVLNVRRLNMYRDSDPAHPELAAVTPLGQRLVYNEMGKNLDDFLQSIDYKAQLAEVEQFNANNKWRKQQLDLMPAKYGMVYTGAMYGCLLSVYPDGSITLTHGGIEMGQGLNTKVAQVVANKLAPFGVTLSQIQVRHSESYVNVNNELTGGSIGSDCLSYTALDAVRNLLDRMRNPANGYIKGDQWNTMVTNCGSAGVELAVKGFYAGDTGDNGLFNYNTYGLVSTNIEVDVLTGETFIKRSDVMLDCGQSINPYVDIGQVEGAYVQAVGYMLSEEMVFDPHTGESETFDTNTYHVPGIHDIPEVFNVSLLKNPHNPAGVMRSKACGEPPMCLSGSITFALRKAMRASIAERNKLDTYSVPFSAPMTVPKTFSYLGVDIGDLVM